MVAFVKLLTSSEVELMETDNTVVKQRDEHVSSDFLGSWINGNPKAEAVAEVKLEAATLLTSSEVELMETYQVLTWFLSI